MKLKLGIATLLVLLAATVATADTFPIQVVGNQADAHIAIGLYQADLSITFENVTGLNATALVVSANVINATDLISRLNDPALITLPGQLPILINISPAAGSALKFQGVVTIEFHTSNLVFDPSLRLFTSPAGGALNDITNFSGVGSYRVHGTGGGFSDFVILSDVRNVDTVIQKKFTDLQNSLNTNASSIAPATRQNLQSKYNAALLAYQSGAKDDAVSNLDAMYDLIVVDHGVSMPYTYNAADPGKKNVGGELRKLIATLEFSLRL